MQSRIIFNGQEYESREAMPPDVRRAYDEALSGLADIGRLALPDSALARGLLPRVHSGHYLRAHYAAKRAAAWVVPILLALATGGMLVAGVWLLWPMHASLRSQGGGFSISPGLLVAVALTTLTGIGVAILLMYRKLDSPETADTDVSAPDAPSGSAEPPANQDVLRVLDRTEHILARVLQLLLGVAAGGVVVGAVWMISNMDPSSRSQAGNVFVAIGALVALACLAGMYISIEMRLRK